MTRPRPSKKERTRTKTIAIEDIRKTHFLNKGQLFNAKASYPNFKTKF